MSPYVATAWFPAAVQGQISLAHGIRGHSKTFSHDVGGMTALGQAMRAIADGRVDAAVCGATESISSEYVRAVLAFDSNAKFAEGSAFLTLERLDQAMARGASPCSTNRLFGTLCRWSGRTDWYAQRHSPRSDAKWRCTRRRLRRDCWRGANTLRTYVRALWSARSGLRRVEPGAELRAEVILVNPGARSLTTWPLYRRAVQARSQAWAFRA